MDRDLIDSWVNDFPIYREEIKSLDFKVSDLEVAQIDSFLPRQTGEKEFYKCVDEKFREFLKLEGAWSYSLRNSLPSSDRSEYIQYLIDKIESGEIKVPAGFPLNWVIDPNEIAFVFAKSDKAISNGFYSTLKQRKVIESQRFWPSTTSLDSSDDSLSKSKINKIIEEIGKEFDLTLGSNITGGEPKILFNKHLERLGCQLSLCWTDERDLTRHGVFNLFFKLSFESKKRFTLEKVLGGGALYKSHIHDLSDVALALQIHALVLKVWTS
jgi:hypothetical protein